MGLGDNHRVDLPLQQHDITSKIYNTWETAIFLVRSCNRRQNVCFTCSRMQRSQRVCAGQTVMAEVKNLTDLLPDGMTPAFSNGTVKVSSAILHDVSTSTLTQAAEYLRGQGGTNENNECAAMFKEYQKCLTVCSLSQPRLDKEELTAVYHR